MPPLHICCNCQPIPNASPYWTWQKGHWVKRPSHYSQWIPSHWAQRDGGWVYVEGHWQ